MKPAAATCLLLAFAGADSAPAADLDLASAAALEIDGTRLSLDTTEGRLRDADLVGVEIEIPELGDLRIDGVELDDLARFKDIWLYQAQVQVPGGVDFESFCEPDETGDTRVVFFAGGFDAAMRYREDASRFSLSCVSGVQAKCLRWGYVPWREAPDTGVKLTEHYNACLHLARADYCGDDQPGTRDGTQVDVYDRVGVMAPEAEPGELVFEAGWTADGAVCVHHTRIPEVLELPALAARCPQLTTDAIGPNCTEAESERRGAVLFNRSRNRSD